MNKPIKTTNKTKAIPRFANEADERAFWETHDSAEYLDWSNAQRAMLAALQAHRERRYADFARLADSHWAKHPGVAAMLRSGRPPELSASRPDPDPAASALPPKRALR